MLHLVFTTFWLFVLGALGSVEFITSIDQFTDEVPETVFHLNKHGLEPMLTLGLVCKAFQSTFDFDSLFLRSKTFRLAVTALAVRNNHLISKMFPVNKKSKLQKEQLMMCAMQCRNGKDIFRFLSHVLDRYADRWNGGTRALIIDLIHQYGGYIEKTSLFNQMLVEMQRDTNPQYRASIALRAFHDEDIGALSRLFESVGFSIMTVLDDSVLLDILLSAHLSCDERLVDKLALMDARFSLISKYLKRGPTLWISFRNMMRRREFDDLYHAFGIFGDAFRVFAHLYLNQVEPSALCKLTRTDLLLTNKGWVQAVGLSDDERSVCLEHFVGFDGIKGLLFKSMNGRVDQEAVHFFIASFPYSKLSMTVAEAIRIEALRTSENLSPQFIDFIMAQADIPIIDFFHLVALCDETISRRIAIEILNVMLRGGRSGEISAMFRKAFKKPQHPSLSMAVDLWFRNKPWFYMLFDLLPAALRTDIIILLLTVDYDNCIHDFDLNGEVLLRVVLQDSPNLTKLQWSRLRFRLFGMIQANLGKLFAMIADFVDDPTQASAAYASLLFFVQGQPPTWQDIVKWTRPWNVERAHVYYKAYFPL